MWSKDKLHDIKDAAHGGAGTGESWTGLPQMARLESMRAVTGHHKGAGGVCNEHDFHV